MAMSSEITNRPCPWNGAVANLCIFVAYSRIFPVGLQTYGSGEP